MATRNDVPPAYLDRFDAMSAQDQAAALALIDARVSANTNLDGVVSTLRSWASDARATTVTAGNVVAVTQTMVNRLGVFFDRFADLLVNQGRS